MAFDKRAIARLYKKRAGHCDLSANTYYLIGVREFTYRKWRCRLSIWNKAIASWKSDTEKAEPVLGVCL
jgi:RsiW-degrading membrane proteinase PrsW (M82 family)